MALPVHVISNNSSFPTTVNYPIPEVLTCEQFRIVLDLKQIILVNTQGPNLLCYCAKHNCYYLCKIVYEMHSHDFPFYLDNHFIIEDQPRECPFSRSLYHKGYPLQSLPLWYTGRNLAHSFHNFKSTIRNSYRIFLFRYPSHLKYIAKV